MEYFFKPAVADWSPYNRETKPKPKQSCHVPDDIHKKKIYE